MTVQAIQRELRQHAERRYRDGAKAYFKEPIELHGVRTPIVRRIAARSYNTLVKKLKKDEVFELCEDLLKTGYSEERTIAFDWAFRVRTRFEVGDFIVFESWLSKYVSNWAACDDLCCHALGDFIFRFPRFLSEVRKWAGSDNRWLRRAAAVVLIYSVRRDRNTAVAYEIADTLLMDEDDLVQKGYGWMLKEISNRRPRDVFDYVIGHKATMPRTALRYAIEKLPPAMKKRAMAG
jgi:3-methyladenine DNA glycosylase AlkD